MKRCCCCVSLRSGSLIIASLSLVIGIAGVIYGVFELLRGSKIGFVTVGVGIVNTLMAIALTYAIEKEKRLLAKVWVVVSGVTTLLGIGLGIAILIMQNWISGIAVVVAAAIQVYFVIVVYSFVKSLDEPKTPEEGT